MNDGSPGSHSQAPGDAGECPAAADLRAVIDGTLDDAEVEQKISDHLGQCERCRTIVDGYVESNVLAGKLESLQDTRVEIPWDLQNRLDEMARELSPPPGDSAADELADRLAASKRAADGQAAEFLQRLLNVSISANDAPALQPYRIEEVVARGGMGIVARARDVRLHRDVAIKFLDPKLAGSDSFHERFLHEACAVARLSHPNIVQVYEVAEWETNPFLVMEYVAGSTLSQRLQGSGQLPPGDVIRIGRAVALGLAAVHEVGIVHRDVKPSNVLLSDDGEAIRLSDFGLARTEDAPDLTRTGFVAGTPAYMSPEQAEGKPLDARSDLYSLGCVLHAMCFDGPPFLRKFQLHPSSQPGEETEIESPAPNRYPSSLTDLIARLLEIDPEFRIQSAKRVAEKLLEIGLETGELVDTEGTTCTQHEMSTQMLRTNPLPTERLPVQSPELRRWGVGAALGGLLLTMVVVGVVALQDLSSPEPDPAESVAVEPVDPLPASAGRVVPPRADIRKANLEHRLVLLSPDGRQRLVSSSFDDLLEIALANDVIEIDFSGEIRLSPARLRVPIEIRAAEGARPVLVPESARPGEFLPLFICRQPITLRGLTLATPADAGRPPGPRLQMLVQVERGALTVEDCDVELRLGGFEDIAIQVRSAASVKIVNSRVHGGVAVDLDCLNACRLEISNSLLHGACPLIIRHNQQAGPSTVSITHSTLIADSICSVVSRDALEFREEPPILWRTANSVFVARDALFSLGRQIPADQDTSILTKLGDSLWCVADCQSERCVFAIEQRFIRGSRKVRLLRPVLREEIERQRKLPRIASLADFCRLASAGDTGSIEVSYPVDAPLLGPTTADELQQLQTDVLAEAAKAAGRDLEGVGFSLTR
ncbi:MAG: serine/threonine-protein kinase [Planctomycetota bacterium]|jgi:serine/threonine protein kinase